MSEKKRPLLRVLKILLSRLAFDASRLTFHTSRFAAILLLLAFFAQLAFSSRQLSLTSDEPPNLGAGYTYLTTGETWHIVPLGHPPLLVAWVSWPVVLANPHIPLRALPNWGDAALPPYFRALLPLLGPVEQLEVAGRVPVMLLGVLLGSLVFRWAADLFGYKGGLLALALMVFDPTMVAHAQLATTDVGVTLLGFATFFVSWRWARASRASPSSRLVGRQAHPYSPPVGGKERGHPPQSWGGKRGGLWWDVGIGLLSGATMAAKVSGLVWVGLAVGMTLAVEVVRSPHSLPRALGLVLRRAAVIATVTLLFLWGLYGFHVGPAHIGPYLLTVPAPCHWETTILQAASTSGRLMFLAGETRLGEGWWWYFPFAFLIKNPIPLLVIWIGAIIVSVCQARNRVFSEKPGFCGRTRSARRTLTVLDFLFLLAFPVVYVVVAICSGFNIGYRHLLPIHPFLYVLAAQWVEVGKAGQKPGFSRFTSPVVLAAPAASPATSTRSGTRSGVPSRMPGGDSWRKNWVSFVARVLWVVLWIWYVVGTVGIFPNYLAYFNELVGGPSNGYRYLVDSNVDWGQSFKTLRKALDHLDVRPPLRLGHQWYAGPELYGVQYEQIPPFGDDFSVAFSPRFDPPPGTYVLGATLLQRGSGDLEQYEWFKHHTPLARPGYGLFVYRVDPHQPPATWIAQCTRPAPPLDDGLIAREFHTQPLRRVYFDCTESWIYPEAFPSSPPVGGKEGEGEQTPHAVGGLVTACPVGGKEGEGEQTPHAVGGLVTACPVGGEEGGTSGWYALHDQILQETQEGVSFLHATPVAQHLDQTHLAYVHHQYDGLAPAFHLYEFRPSMQVLEYTRSVRVAPSEMSPTQVVAEQPVITAPLRLEGPLAFLGYRLLDVGAEAVTLETWWKVVELEVGEMRPLSIMAHLVDGDGRPVAVADGLGVPMEVWQAGDVVVQYHHFPLTPDLWGNTYWLQTGVYWLDTMERWPVLADGETVGDRVVLTSVELPRR